MEIGTVISVAETLISVLQSPRLKAVLLMRHYKSQVNELQDTVKTLKAVLSDAGTKQELSSQEQVFVQKLKDAVFEADDLFDEFLTLAERKKLRKAYGTLSEKARDFFSVTYNPVSRAYRVSRGVKDIKKKLDDLTKSSQLCFKIDPTRKETAETRMKRIRETSSYVDVNKIIGRQDDLDSIVSVLLGSEDQRGLSVLSIVGIGGLGKTALAQLVYNDPRVAAAFPSKIWTCVSDENQELDVKSFLVKILASVTGSNPDHGATLDQVQSRLGENLTGEKYLLVLDDVWTENPNDWCGLVEYLNRDNKGSWVVVTTRSQKTAEITRGKMHELSGLSKKESWHLFATAAFASDQPKPPRELVEIGQDIVDGCRGVPLAIKVAGSFLCNQDKKQWQSVQEIGLVCISDNYSGIKPILELSYHHLESSLKNCFLYCALFPKDHEMEKQMLISLWMAQGYIVPFDQHQSIEDAGEEYFSILTRRCFFQDIKKDEFGEIKSCKIHDLLHDIARCVAGKEISALHSNSDVEKNVRHLYISSDSEYGRHYSSGKTHIRSLLFYNCEADSPVEVKALVGKFRCLRVLVLREKNIKHLPGSIGKLLHLRYIDLSNNKEIEALPDSITKLYNLQTLMLAGCINLEELPKEFSRLVNLRVLDILGPNKITCMPRGMDKLTCLHTLKGAYRIGYHGSRSSWEQFFDGLQDLKTLTNLKGELTISTWWPNNAKNDVKEDRKEGLYLSSMEHLNSISLCLNDGEGDGRIDNEDVTIMKLMENLRPHSNLKCLLVDGYPGVKMPDWITLLRHLVSLHFQYCEDLKYLPCLGNLCHLKSLHLMKLSKLEYIEVELVSFSSSLEDLWLDGLPKFEGWRSRAGARAAVGTEESSDSSSKQPHLLQCLPQLKKLNIQECPELMCIMVCPMLETLEWGCNSGRWQIVWGKKADEILSEAAAIIRNNNPENNYSSFKSLVPNLMRKMNNVSNEEAWLNWKPMESFHTLQYLYICDDKMEELPSWMEYLSALHSLHIWECKKLKAMPNWMPKLTSLQFLSIHGCSKSLKKRCQKDPPGKYWPYIQHIPKISFH